MIYKFICLDFGIKSLFLVYDGEKFYDYMSYGLVLNINSNERNLNLIMKPQI